MGELSGEYLACGYHGLKFDVNGRCVEVPGQPEVPSGAQGAQLSGAGEEQRRLDLDG